MSTPKSNRYYSFGLAFHTIFESLNYKEDSIVSNVYNLKIYAHNRKTYNANNVEIESFSKEDEKRWTATTTEEE